jgi:hypothetical protein
MIPTLVILLLLWALATLAVYGGLVIALFIRFTNSGMDRRELPGVLRGSWKFGLGAMGCLLAGVVFVIAWHAWWDGGFDPRSITSIAEWCMDAGYQVLMLGPFATITIVPTGWCWIWERRLRWMQG